MSCPTQQIAMAIADTDSAERKFLYENMKKPYLDDALGNKEETSVIYYERTGFVTMINTMSADSLMTGIKVYLGSFKFNNQSENNQLIKTGKDDTFALIFVPTKLDNGRVVDIEEYYIMPSEEKPTTGPVSPATHTRQTDRKISAQDWISNYKSSKVALLKLHMPKNRKETESIWYNKSDFADLVSYITCGGYVGRPAKDFSHVTVSFGAYKIAETINVPAILSDTPGKYPVSGQLTLVFGLIEKVIGEPKDKLQFIYKPVSLYDSLVKPKAKQFDDFDTGVPIPPGV